MKSFLEFVSCCVMTPVNEEEVAATETATVAEAQSRVEETRSLIPQKEVALRSKKRVRVSGSGSMNSAEWKPSLYMISEDKVMAEMRENSPPAAEDRAVKKKSKTGSQSKVHVRSYSDDKGKNPVPAIIPMFSPSPFMF